MLDQLIGDNKNRIDRTFEEEILDCFNLANWINAHFLTASAPNEPYEHSISCEFYDRNVFNIFIFITMQSEWNI